MKMFKHLIMRYSGNKYRLIDRRINAIMYFNIYIIFIDIQSTYVFILKQRLINNKYLYSSRYCYKLDFNLSSLYNYEHENAEFKFS